MTIYYKDANIYIRDRNKMDIQYLAEHFRPEEIESLRVLSPGLTPLDALNQSVQDSQEIYIMSRVKNCVERPIGCCGLQFSCSSSEAMVWFISTEETNLFKIQFLKACRFLIDRFLNRFDTLFNFIYTENTKTLEFLKRLGATCEDPIDCGTIRLTPVTLTKER